MPEKDSEDSFYYLNAYQDDITPGQKMTILHNISFNDWRAGPHIAPLVTLTREEVTQRKEASITLEKELYAQLKKLAAAWDEQAAQTMLLERALEYLQTPEVEHTSNEWKQDKNGIWEISNRTYKMRYKISYEKAADVYLVSWGIIYNAPKQPDSNYRNYWGDSIYVARQDKKKYPSMEAAQHYIHGCSVPTAIWRQGTRWLHQIRKNPTRRPLMTCWPVWMTRMPQYLQRRSRKCIFLKRRLNAKSPFQ